MTTNNNSTLGFTILENYIYGLEKPQQFSPTAHNPLKGHGDMSWTAPGLETRSFEEKVVQRIQGQYSTHAANIKALKFAQPSVVWTKRAIKVLTLAAIGLGVAVGIVGTAKLLLPLIIVGSLLAVSLLIYNNMCGNISNEAKKLAKQHQKECTTLAWTDPLEAGTQYDKYRSNPLPAKPKKQPMTVKEYSDAYNDFVAQHMLESGHCARLF